MTMETKMIVIGVLALLATAYLVSQEHNKPHPEPSDDIPSPIYDAFVHFQKRYNKKYASSDEKNFRLQVYYDNFQLIVENNNDETKTYTLGET